MRCAYEVSERRVCSVLGCGKDLAAQQLTSFITWALKKNPTCGFYQRMGGKIIADKLEEIGGKKFKEIAYL